VRLSALGGRLADFFACRSPPYSGSSAPISLPSPRGPDHPRFGADLAVRGADHPLGSCGPSEETRLIRPSLGRFAQVGADHPRFPGGQCLARADHPLFGKGNLTELAGLAALANPRVLAGAVDPLPGARRPKVAGWFSSRPSEVRFDRTDPSLLSNAACRIRALSRGAPSWL
jgi:hypothetical protein